MINRQVCFMVLLILLINLFYVSYDNEVNIFDTHSFHGESAFSWADGSHDVV